MILPSIMLWLSLGTTTPFRDEPKTIPQQIVQSAMAHDLDPGLCLKIAECESGYRQFNPDGTLFRGKINPQDVGIFQVNEFYHLDHARALKLNIESVEGNIEYSMRLMKDEGTKPWDWSKDCWSKVIDKKESAVLK